MPDQGVAWILRDSPSEKRQTLEFNLEAASVNSNIFYYFRSCYLSWIGNGKIIYWHQVIQFFLQADTRDLNTSS